jgi:hypothetical protein
MNQDCCAHTHRAFSLAIRTISAAICGSIGGLSGVRSLP